MLSSSFKTHISQVLGCLITRVEPVSGGDISRAYCIHAQTQRFFCKVNNSPVALKMFATEKAGLEGIQQSKTIKVPEIHGCGQFNSYSFLLMDFIESKNPDQSDMENFGHRLAEMHSYIHEGVFGWEQDNFIGSLPQSNLNHPEWSTFFVLERLIPQLTLAQERKLIPVGKTPSKDVLLKRCQELFPKIKPVLLHGDLWSGNYLIGTQGEPYLIDPSVYFGHAVVDLAMTRLFGGFGAPFYRAYQEYLPSSHNEKQLTEIYQLYYLLVHLNLFGNSYLSGVTSILKRYFQLK